MAKRRFKSGAKDNLYKSIVRCCLSLLLLMCVGGCCKQHPLKYENSDGDVNLSEVVDVKIAAFRYLLGIDNVDTYEPTNLIIFLEGNAQEQLRYQQAFTAYNLRLRNPNNMIRDSHKNVLDRELQMPAILYGVYDIEIWKDNATAIGTWSKASTASLRVRLHMRKYDGKWKVIAKSEEMVS